MQWQRVHGQKQWFPIGRLSDIYQLGENLNVNMTAVKILHESLDLGDTTITEKTYVDIN